jgi:hypothetical protein
MTMGTQGLVDLLRISAATEARTSKSLITGSSIFLYMNISYVLCQLVYSNTLKT